MDIGLLAILLIGAHFLADFPLQGEYLAKAKNRYTEGVSGTPWGIALAAHGFIHGSLVALITGIWWLGLIETILHIEIDDKKCKGSISYTTDQLLHLSLKLIYLVVTLYMVN